MSYRSDRLKGQKRPGVKPGPFKCFQELLLLVGESLFVNDNGIDVFV